MKTQAVSWPTFFKEFNMLSKSTSRGAFSSTIGILNKTSHQIYKELLVSYMIRNNYVDLILLINYTLHNRVWKPHQYVLFVHTGHWGWPSLHHCRDGRSTRCSSCPLDVQRRYHGSIAPGEKSWNPLFVFSSTQQTNNKLTNWQTYKTDSHSHSKLM